MAKSFIDYIDVVSYKPTLLCYGKERYVTNYGITLSLFSFMALISFTVYFFLDLIKGNSMTVVLNQETNQNPTLNMTGLPIMVKLVNSFAEDIVDDIGVYTMLFTYWKFYPVIDLHGINTLKYEIEYLKISKCSNISFGNYSDLFMQIPDISKFYCLDISQQIMLSGLYGYTTNNFSFIDIFPGRCVEKCANDTYIDSQLDGAFFSSVSIDYGINHNDKLYPQKPVLRMDAVSMSEKLYKRYYYYYKSVEYTSDDGIIFNGDINNHFFQYDYKDTVVDIKKGIFPGVFGEVTFCLSAKIDAYSRKYLKLQTVLANIGGIIKGIFIIAGFVGNIISEKLYYLSFIDKGIVKSDNISNTANVSVLKLIFCPKKHTSGNVANLMNVFEEIQMKMSIDHLLNVVGNFSEHQRANIDKTNIQGKVKNIDNISNNFMIVPVDNDRYMGHHAS